MYLMRKFSAIDYVCTYVSFLLTNKGVTMQTSFKK